MPALTATSALVGAMVLLGVWSGRRWGRRRKRALDAEATGSASAEAARTMTPTRSNAVRSPGRTRRPLPELVQHH